MDGHAGVTATGSREHGGDGHARLREARQQLSQCVRACRQTITYLQGKSCLDQRRLQRVLEDVVRAGENFLDSP
ncbi:MAG: hypothetical protein FJ225_10615 [Lentisphaerae bacterium]|nr:hypothetical protein [Lentisphaerota bacterium]